MTMSTAMPRRALMAIGISASVAVLAACGGTAEGEAPAPEPDAEQEPEQVDPTEEEPTEEETTEEEPTEEETTEEAPEGPEQIEDPEGHEYVDLQDVSWEDPATGESVVVTRMVRNADITDVPILQLGDPEVVLLKLEVTPPPGQESTREIHLAWGDPEASESALYSPHALEEMEALGFTELNTIATEPTTGWLPYLMLERKDSYELYIAKEQVGIGINEDHVKFEVS